MVRTAILFCFLFLLPVIMYCQRCDSIAWSKHHDLKWKNFKALADRRSTADALSDISIFYKISTAERFARFLVTCFFYPCKSWVKRVSTGRLLEHEQTHFDIAEYHKRLLMKEIMNRKFTAANIFSSVEEFGKMITDLRKDMDEVYDLETNHSLNMEKQKEWSIKMSNLLKKLGDYEGGSYIITLN
jgi:hypothetical protein